MPIEEHRYWVVIDPAGEALETCISGWEDESKEYAEEVVDCKWKGLSEAGYKCIKVKIVPIEE